MAQPTYYELLKHPEWQKKRLRIMERDGFQCQECGDKETTLNVHHSYYTKGAKPWEYPDESLRCLCEPCHGERHTLDAELKAALGSLTSVRDIGLVLGFVKALAALDRAAGVIRGEAVLRLDSYEQIEGAAIGYLTQAFGALARQPHIADQIVTALGPGSEISDAALCDLIESNLLSSQKAA